MSFAMDSPTIRPVEVNVESCRRLASLIRKWDVPADQEDSSLPGLSKEQIGSYYLFLVTICHQTSPRGIAPLEGMIDGQRRRGWDFMTAKFEAAVRSDHQLLNPSRWSSMTPGEITRLFRDQSFGDRLSDPAGRSSLVNDLGQVMLSNDWSTPEDIFRLCGGRVATGSPTLLGELGRFRAYDDPVRKKSFFFLSVMKNSKLWVYPDDELLGPPVDYHEVRGHLRIGTVAVRDEILRNKIRREEPVTAAEDVAIRSAVREAIVLVSEFTGNCNPSQLHYLFWNVFRSCCKHDETHCHSCPVSCTLPERYIPLTVHDHGPRRCPFSQICCSVDQPDKLYEHVFDTDYY